MRIALVLGAGATLAQAEHLKNLGRGEELPPLDATFFDRICQLKIEVGDALRAYGQALHEIDLFSPGESKPSMEEFFKDVFYDFISARKKSPPSAQVYGELIVAYRRVLLRTTNWLRGDAASGPMSGLIGAAAEAAEQVDIVTFNHDLLIENTLADLPDTKRRWCLRHGYGHFARDRHFTSQKAHEMFEDPKTCEHPEPIRVYKLHGSLNWFVDSDSFVPAAGALRGEREDDQKIQVTRRRTVPDPLRRKGQPASWPVLIPPIYAKQTFIHNFMRPVWSDARRALAACDRLVFYGYSMPVLDVEAEKEFQRAVARNSRLTYIDVVNPAPVSAGRYARVFHRRSVHWHPDLNDYLAAEPFG